MQEINYSRASFLGAAVLFSLYLVNQIFFLDSITFLAFSISFTLLGLFFIIVYQSPTALFAPISWFVLACSIYYGFGSLFYSFGGYEGMNYIDSWYFVDDSDLINVNHLNVIAITLTLLFFSLMMKIRLISIKSSSTLDSNLIALADRFAWN